MNYDFQATTREIAKYGNDGVPVTYYTQAGEEVEVISATRLRNPNTGGTLTVGPKTLLYGKF